MDRYVVVGNPIEHSQSPFIQGEFARQTGEAIEYGRLLCPLDDFTATIRALAADGARGCNITVPFKFEAFEAATRRTERARLAGAANVLAFGPVPGDRHAGEARARSPEGWLADNSDGVGLVRDIVDGAGVPLAGKRLLLIGAGGAGAGVLGPLLAERPAHVVVANRTEASAQALVARHREVAGAAELEARPTGDCGAAFDVVINATATSLQGAAVPVGDVVIGPGTLAVDLMYGPAARGFLDWAEARGARGRDGLGMLVEQAAEAFLLWRGVRPLTAPVLAALRQRLADTKK